VQGRTNDYEEVGRFFAERPITGRGFSTLLGERYLVLDNQYLGLVVETGVLGTTAFALFFVVGLGTARGTRRGAEPSTRSLGQALAATCVAVLVVAATFDLLAFAMVSGVAFLVVGCAGALWRLTRAGDIPLPATTHSNLPDHGENGDVGSLVRGSPSPTALR
jgi:polysaccharide biosynthesis protein PslJ